MWWVKYYADGRPRRESTGVEGASATPPAEAKRFLKIREGKVAGGEAVLPRVDRIRYEEAAEDLLRHTRRRGSATPWRRAGG